MWGGGKEWRLRSQGMDIVSVVPRPDFRVVIVVVITGWSSTWYNTYPINIEGEEAVTVAVVAALFRDCGNLNQREKQKKNRKNLSPNSPKNKLMLYTFSTIFLKKKNSSNRFLLHLLPSTLRKTA